MQEILNILPQFESVTLEELESLQLLDRRDTKYVFNVKYLPAVLERLHSKYKILEMEGASRFHYENVYFDTKDLLLYKHHHNGKKDRFKVRYRHYVEADKYFFEVKFKSNRGKTYKKRLQSENFEESINPEGEMLLRDWMHFEAKDLAPSASVNYKRITLIDSCKPEKITLDYCLDVGGNGGHKTFPELVIAELKQPKLNNHSEFAALMKEMHIAPLRISKYVIAALSNYSNLKYNRFKTTILKLNNIIQEKDEYIRHTAI